MWESCLPWALAILSTSAVSPFFTLILYLSSLVKVYETSYLYWWKRLTTVYVHGFIFWEWAVHGSLSVSVGFILDSLDDSRRVKREMGLAF